MKQHLNTNLMNCSDASHLNSCINNEINLNNHTNALQWATVCGGLARQNWIQFCNTTAFKDFGCYVSILAASATIWKSPDLSASVAVRIESGFGRNSFSSLYRMSHYCIIYNNKWPIKNSQESSNDLWIFPSSRIALLNPCTRNLSICLVIP